MPYEQELEFAKDLSLEAGRLTRESFGIGIATTWKQDNTPLTETDLAINDFVINSVNKEFPEDGVLGEEASTRTEANRLWVVDPIDGTQPFSVGVPVSTFCLALVVDNEPILGVVYDPYQDRLYSATKGKGASLNGERISVSNSTEIAKNYVVLSSRMGEVSRTTGEVYDAVIKERGKAFNLRSIAYGLMLVANGACVASVAGAFGPWDVAAAKVILEEAGAKITNLKGGEVKYDDVSTGFLATNGKVHEKILELVCV